MRPFLFGLLVIVVPSAAAAQTLYSVSVEDDQLRTIDPQTGLTLASKTILPPAGYAGVFGVTALAAHPTTANQLWAAIYPGEYPMLLATIDLSAATPTTVSVTVVAEIDHKLDEIAFDYAGSLYAVSADDDHGGLGEMLYQITGATVQPVMPLGAGDDGEAIAFGPGGRLYHASGRNNVVFEFIDVASLDVFDIPLSGEAPSQPYGLTYSTSQAAFFWADDGGVASGRLLRVTADGAVTTIGTLDHFSGGLALPGQVLPRPDLIFRDGFDS